MSATQTVDATADGTGRSYFNNYVRANSSEKAAHAELFANLVPLETLSWRDVFKATDAVAKHVAAGIVCTSSVQIQCLSNVLQCCAPAGTSLRICTKTLWQVI